jgi:two-component system, OmpR family, response regulator
VTIRILADRQPYSAYAPATGDPTDPSGSVLILNGPARVDEAPPDLLVLPAEDFLSLMSASRSGAEGRTSYLPYGPVDLMDRAFELGCVDYIREPWSLPELRARAGRLRRLKFKACGKVFECRPGCLESGSSRSELGEGEGELLRLLIARAPHPLSREAALQALDPSSQGRDRALIRRIAALRRKLDALEPGLGRCIVAIRNLGYRLDASRCG